MFYYCMFIHVVWQTYGYLTRDIVLLLEAIQNVLFHSVFNIKCHYGSII